MNLKHVAKDDSHAPGWISLMASVIDVSACEYALLTKRKAISGTRIKPTRFPVRINNVGYNLADARELLRWLFGGGGAEYLATAGLDLRWGPLVESAVKKHGVEIDYEKLRTEWASTYE